MTTTKKPLQFDSASSAEAWLKSTGNYGLVHHGSRAWIALQFADGAVWAFTDRDEMVLLPDW